MGDTCITCGKEYKRIATHWARGSCNHPSFTDKQKEIITGTLMGDGCVQQDKNKSRNPRLVINMTNKKYLEDIDEKFKVFGNGVKLTKTAEKSAEENINTNFDPNANKENYSNIYRWSSMRHPELKKFRQWYSIGEKVWPENIKLTPTVLKHWYCGDGSLVNIGSSNRIRISMANEKDNTKKVNSIFTSVGLPSPKNYVTTQRQNGSVRCAAQFTVEQSKQLWQYMGEPLPDFEYKWPKEQRQI